MIISAIPQPATKRPINLVLVKHLAKVRGMPLQPTWSGKVADMPTLRAELRKRQGNYSEVKS
jgi:hypothetical protein